MHAVKYHKGLSNEDDSRRDVCDFFGVTDHDLTLLQSKYGSFSSRQFQQHVYAFFEGRTADEDSLFRAYGDAAFYYCLMLGLGCPRYATLYPFLEYLLPRFDRLGRRPVAVDYGSGVGDTAILLAAHGFDIVLVDLPDRKSEFARWRLQRRGYEARFIPVTADDPYPCLPPVDLVITIEVWEHLRSPVTALNNINAATTPGQSYLMNTNVGFDYTPEGDHLTEGIAEGRSQTYEKLYAMSWRALNLGAPDGDLFVRI
jgi:hypothetical protein